MSEYIIKAADWAIDYKGESLFKGCDEIVRCRDCRYFRVGANTDCCAFTEKYAHAEGFCSWGERKERIEQ